METHNQIETQNLGSKWKLDGMAPPLINLVLPVYSGEGILARAVQKIIKVVPERISEPFELVIAENGSTDGTLNIARRLEYEYPFVHALHLEQKGRGRALKEAWRQSQADILSYMDVDLSTDLEAYPALIEPLCSGGYDLATGSRLLKQSRTTRSAKRDAISRIYNQTVKLVFRTRFSDAQCGFKAITRAAANDLLPRVQDDGWFFDAELLVLAEKLGYRIFDLPVRWTENRRKPQVTASNRNQKSAPPSPAPVRYGIFPRICDHLRVSATICHYLPPKFFHQHWTLNLGLLLTLMGQPIPWFVFRFDQQIGHRDAAVQNSRFG